MGWSCTAKADDTMDALTRACEEQTGRNNVWEANGSRYFWERGQEQADGAITGTIWRYLPDGEHVHYRKAGSFRIEPSGQISRGPKHFQQLAGPIRSAARVDRALTDALANTEDRRGHRRARDKMDAIMQNIHGAGIPWGR